MCLVISIVMLVLSYNLYLTENFLGSIGSFLTAILFIWLMLRNIQRVKKIRKKKGVKNVD